MIRTRENSVVYGLLVLCIAAGFACFAWVFLPDQLTKAGIASKARSTTGPLNISDLIKLKTPPPPKKPVAPARGTIAKFVPEEMPADPFAREEAPPGHTDDPDYYDGAGGAGAAVEADTFEGRGYLEAGPEPSEEEGIYAQAATGEYEPDLAIGDPYGEMLDEGVRSAYLDGEPAPETVRHPVSSLARGDPAAIDSERGKRKMPWLLPPPGLEKDVAFWRDIYSKYDQNHAVLHHPRHLEIVYDVVNLSDIENDPRLNDIEKEHMKERRIDSHRERIEDALQVLATNPMSSGLTHEQWRIKQLFDGVNEAKKFERALKEDGVRAQIGQRDKFIKGLAVSGRYLGEIESIFEAYGLPKELTRLIFVESMFDTKAISSAGASGIWQFMPRTGRLYLGITKIADERNDPIKSTHAAAKLLRHNYDELGTWPLAINAYNTGRGRLKQAVQKLGTRDIGRIIRDFDHRYYGFASRNFYLEFLAAYEVAEHAERYFGRVQHDEPLRYEIVRSNYHLSLPEVARLADIPMEEMQELNPAFTSYVTSGKKLLPRRTAIRVPERRGDVFLATAARAPGSKTGALHHVVRRGETLGSIARAYGVTPAAIMRSNRHVGRSLKQGQKLVIPPGGT